MTTTVQYLLDVARFAAVDAAHELRRDYERGVFSRQNLGIIGFFLVNGPIMWYGGSILLAIASIGAAAWTTYVVAQADRRWRDQQRDDP